MGRELVTTATVKPADDDSIMHFGKHKGRPLHKVPASYLLWLWDNHEGYWQKDSGSVEDMMLKRYLEDNLSAIEMDAPDVIVVHRPSR